MATCKHCGYTLHFRWKRQKEDGTWIRYKRPCPIHEPYNPNCPGR